MPPVKLAVFTMVVNIPLLAITLPVALSIVATILAPFILPAVDILPPITSPLAETRPLVNRLPTVAFPVTLSVGRTPTLVATTPVNWLPLPRI